jgi:hypothetical protein
MHDDVISPTLATFLARVPRIPPADAGALLSAASVNTADVGALLTSSAVWPLVARREIEDAIRRTLDDWMADPAARAVFTAADRARVIQLGEWAGLAVALRDTRQPLPQATYEHFVAPWRSLMANSPRPLLPPASTTDK